MQNTGRYRQVRASTSKNRCVARRYVQRGFARQQWRAWIETPPPSLPRSPTADSPASNGGRGLKHCLRPAPRVLCRDSPASNGGRGLKHAKRYNKHPGFTGFARQQWRAWIETTAYCSTEYTWPDSPASNGGRGLKLFQKASIKIAASGFARQQWRAWIET